MKTVYKSTTTITQHAELLVQEVTPTILVFKHMLTYEGGKPDGDLIPYPQPNTVRQGFIDPKELKRLTTGKEYKTLSQFCIMLPEGRKLARTVGLNHVDHEMVEKSKPRDVYDQFVSGAVTVDDIVEYQMDTGMIFDHAGEVLPSAIYFDYINFHMTDGAYDLVKAAKHLMQRKDITVFKGTAIRSNISPTVAATVEDAIFNVPYYNAEEGCRRTISFRWEPSREDFAAMWNKCKTYRGKFHTFGRRYDAIRDLDLLGLRECGAMRKEAY